MKRSCLLALSVFHLAAQAVAATADNTAAATNTATPATPAAPGSQDASATVQLMVAIRGEVIASDQLAGQFSTLAGSHENAQNLVVGLRNAKPVKMVAAKATEPEVSFTPPTRPMSFSDVHHALLLAQAHLQSKNITNPTPAQVKAALAGGDLPNAQGDITRVIGILPLHQRGMSWEAIARALRIAGPKKVA